MAALGVGAAGGVLVEMKREALVVFCRGMETAADERALVTDRANRCMDLLEVGLLGVCLL